MKLTKTVKIPASLMRKILETVNDSMRNGYNGAWLDGYEYLAKEIGLVRWDCRDKRFVVIQDK